MIEFHSRPFVLKEFKIEVTYKCQLNCVHCSSDAQENSILEIERSDCIRILEEAASLGVKQVAFSGGEPLLWPHIGDIVRTATDNDMMVTIYSSGNVENYAEKAASLYSYGASRMVFSIFGGTAVTHERVTRVTGSFHKTLRSLEEARLIGYNTEFHFVPMTNNYKELNDVALLGKTRGVTAISVLRLVPQGRASLLKNRVLKYSQNIELRNQILDLRKQGFNIRVGSPYNIFRLNSSPQCCAAIDRLIIAPDLRVYPCDAFKQIKAEEIVGSLDYSCLKELSLRECWGKSLFLEAIRNYLTTPFEEPCESCKYIKSCFSGCLAQKVIKYGDLKKRRDPDCLADNA